MSDTSLDWDDVALEDLGEIVAGGTPSRAVPSFWNGDIPWVTPTEITSLKGKYLRETRECITREGLSGSAARLLPEGALLITSRATLGEVAIAGVPVATNQGFKSIVPNEATDSLFAYYRIGSLKREMERLASGTTFLEISKADFSRIRTLRPKPAEQAGIAVVLDMMDEAIAKTEAVIAKLKQVRAGLLHDLLTRGLDKHGQFRDPIAHPEQFKDSPLGRIPNKWDVGPFREFACPDRPYLKTGPFGSSLKQEHWVPEGVPVVTIGSLGEGEFIQSELLHISKETARSLSAYALIPGDIVFSRVADVGRSVVVSEAESGWIMSSNMMWISLDRDEVEPAYLQLNLATNAAVRTQISRLVNAGGRDVANAAVMNSLILPWAPIEEQRSIMVTIRSLESRIDSEEAEQHKSHLLRQGLMSDLLTGRVRVAEGVYPPGRKTP